MKVKKIHLLFSLLLGIIAVFSISQKVYAAEALCCPDGYQDTFWSCPFGVDKNLQCCNRVGFANYDIVDKVVCDVQVTPTPEVNIPEPKAQTLDSLNPLKIASSKADRLSTPGGIISEVLKYAFPLAGMILFIMILFGGFQMLTGASTSKSVEEGKKKITAAILGFLLLFASYWIAQLIEIIFSIKIL